MMKTVKFTLERLICFTTVSSLVFKSHLTEMPNKLCRNKPCGPCSICVRSHDFKDNCLGDHFEELYNDSKTCLYKDNCIPGICENNATCVSLFGSFICECDDAYFGHHCESENIDKSSYVRGLSIVYAPIVAPLAINYILVCAEDVGTNFRLFFKDGEQRISQIFTQTVFEHGNPRRICLKEKIASESICEFMPDDYAFLILRIPMAYAIYPTRTLRSSLLEEHYPAELSINPLGYFSNFKITILNQRLVQFETIYPRFIKYPEDTSHLKCLPQIGFQNCAHHYEDPIVLHRSTETALHITISHSNDESCGSPIISWEIWYHSLNHNEDLDDPIIVQQHLMKYDICPYCLPTGMYKVKVRVDVPYRDNNFELKSSNLGYCYFRIMTLPLIAIIEGGDFRSAYAESDLVLDASRSKDHNERSDNQHHILFTWRCDQDYHFCEDYITKSRKYIIPGPFQMGRVFKFTLEVAAAGLKKAYATQIVTMTSSYQTNWLITCLWNCGRHNYESNPDDLTYFLITTESEAADSIDDFVWYYNEDEYEQQQVTVIAQDNIPNFVLIINNGALNEGSKYTITAERKSFAGKAAINIHTGKRPIKGICIVTPTFRVTEGHMKYLIVCTNFQSYVANGILTYSFRSVDSNDDTVGIPLGENSIGLLKDVALSLPKMIIRASDSNGMHVETYADVEMPRVLTSVYESLMDIFLDKLRSLLEDGDQTVPLRLIATYAYILKKSSDRLHYLWELLNIMNKLLLYNQKDTEMLLAALLRILQFGTQYEKYGMDRNSVYLASRLLNKVTNQLFRNMIVFHNEEQTVFMKDIKRIGKSLLIAVNIIMESRGEQKYATLDDTIATDMYKKLRDASITISRVLDKMISVFQLQILPAEIQITLNTKKSSAWIKMDTPQRLSDLKNIPRGTKTFLIISRSLAQELRERWMFFTLGVVILEENPFWWDGDKVFIGTELIQVSLFTGQVNKSIVDVEPVTDISNSIDLYLNVKLHAYQLIHGTVTTPDVRSSAEVKDSLAQIYRMTPPDNSGHVQVVLVFAEIPPNQNFKILMSHGVRPDYDMIMETGDDANIVTAKHTLSVYNYDPDKFVYIGILPSPDTNVGVSINYSFRIEQVQCHDRQGTTWGTDNCKVGYSYSEFQVHCQCLHLSLFAVGFSKMPVRLDYFKEYDFTIVIKTNLFPVIFILSILAMYIVLFIYSYCKDQLETDKSFITILDDNYPGDKWPYLVTVFTGARLFSGSNCNIGIQIHGQLSSSRVHILQSGEKRNSLECIKDDWFLLYAPEWLGEIQSIHFWRDNVRCSNWYCDKIIVKDLVQDQDYVFFVGEWLSVDYPYENLEVVRSPATTSEKYTFSRLFIDNLLHILREEHLWISVVLHHPRSLLKRTERLSILMCTIMLIVASSVILHVFAEGEGVDSPSYSISKKHVFTALECHLIAVVIAALVLWLFKWSVTDNVPNNIVCDLEEYRVKKAVHDYEGSFSEEAGPKEKNVGGEPSESAENYKQSLNNELKYEVKVKLEDANQPISKDNTYGLLAKIRNVCASIKTCVQQDKWKTLSTYKNACKNSMEYAAYVMICNKSLRPIKVRGDKHNYVTVHPLRKRLAWFCSITLIVVCFVLGMSIGPTIGTFDSQLWVTTIIMALVLCVFITTPLYIILGCLFFSLVLKKRTNTSKYVCEPGEWLPKLASENVSLLEKVLKLRSRPIYQPMDLSNVNKLRIQIKERRVLLKLLNIIGVVICTVLVFITAGSLKHLQFIANRHIENTLWRRNHTSLLRICKNRTLLNLYIVNSLLPTIHNLKWYNDKLIDYPDAYFFETGWVKDYTYRLMGTPHFRQLRSTPEGDCNVPKLLLVFMNKCFGDTFNFVEDTKNYVLGWKPLLHDPMVVTPWTYVSPGNSSSSSHTGVAGHWHHSGGYVANLSRTLNVSRKLVWKLEEAQWIDDKTRVLYIGFTLYNVNFNWLSDVTIILEYIPGAGFITTFRVMTTKYTFNVPLLYYPIALFVLLFIFKIIIGCNRKGRKYLTDYSNLLNFPIVVFMAGLLICLSLQKYITESTVTEFQSHGHNIFFTFFRYKTFYRTLAVFQMLIIISLTLKLLVLIKFGQRTNNYAYTLILAKKHLFICVCLISPLVYLTSASVTYLLGNQLFPNSLAVVFYRLSFRKLSINSVFPHVKLPIVLFCFLHCFLIFLCTCFIVHFYMRVKSYTRNLKSEMDNVFQFYYDKLKSICLRKEHNEKTRLRGGGDLELSKLAENMNMCSVPTCYLCCSGQNETNTTHSQLEENLFKVAKYTKRCRKCEMKITCENVLYKLDVIIKRTSELFATL